MRKLIYQPKVTVFPLRFFETYLIFIIQTVLPDTLCFGPANPLLTFSKIMCHESLAKNSDAIRIREQGGMAQTATTTPVNIGLVALIVRGIRIGIQKGNLA